MEGPCLNFGVPEKASAVFAQTHAAAYMFASMYIYIHTYIHTYMLVCTHTDDPGGERVYT